MSKYGRHDSANMRVRHNYQLLERGVLVKLVGDPATGAWTIKYPKNGVLQPDELSVVITTPWRYDRLVEVERAAKQVTEAIFGSNLIESALASCDWLSDGCLSDLTLRKMMKELGYDVRGE